MKLPKPADGGNYDPCPPGNHLAICYSVVDMGTQSAEFSGETKVQRKIRISWEISQERMGDGRPFSLSRTYTLSGHEKSTLRKHLDSWRGRRFSEEDFEKFDIKALIGKGCMLNVVHNESGDKIYANVDAVAALPKGMAVSEPENDVLYFSLDPDEFSMDTFAKLHEKTQEKIQASPEWAALATKATPAAKAKKMVETEFGAYEDGEDIPF